MNTEFKQVMTSFHCISPLFPNDMGSTLVLQSNDSIFNAFKKLIDRKYLAAPIVDEKTGQVVSMCNITDIIKLIIREFSSEELKSFDNHLLESRKEIANMHVTQLTDRSAEGPTFIVGEHDTILHATEIMVKEKAHRVVVLDKDSRPVSVITQSRILKLVSVMLRRLPLTRKSLHELQIDEKPVVSINERKMVIDAFKLMTMKHVSAVAVVDRSGKLVGTISDTDIRQLGYDLRYFHWLGATCEGFLRHIYTYDGLRTVPDNANPVCVQSNATLGDVIKILTFYSIHRVFVVNAQKEPIGIVSLYDVLSCLLR